MLKITSDGRKLGLDQRIIDPLLPDEPGTKVNLCVGNILRFWREGDAEKLTQLVFCDISTPKGCGSTGGAKEFTIYEDIRQKLINGGMPPEQIVFIHDADTEAKKRDLFAKMRSGQVRVLIGSTGKCGAGMNVQDRLFALHDLDCPWRPRDLTQRKGRIERQGNRNETVLVCRYVTESSFDSYLWQTVEGKQRFISQILTSKSPVRSCEDVDETVLSFAEIKALCAGDPRIKERMDLDVEVSRLKLMRSEHMSSQYRLETRLTKYFPEHIAESRAAIQRLEADLATLETHPLPKEGFAGMEIQGVHYSDREEAGSMLLKAIEETPDGEPVQIGSYRGFAVSAYRPLPKEGFAGMEIQGVHYSDREEAGSMLLKAIEETSDGEPVQIGSYRGFAVSTYYGTLQRPMLILNGGCSLEAGFDAKGNITRIDNELDRLPKRLTAARHELDNLLQQQKAAEAEAGKTFPLEQELTDKTARLALLDMQLNLDDRTGPEQVMERGTSHSPSQSFSRSRAKPSTGHGRER